MTRNGKFLGLSALAALALAAAPAATLAQGGTETDKLEAIQKQLDGMSGRLQKAFDNIAKDMKGVKETIEALKANDNDTTTKVADTLQKMNSLEKTVEQLRADIETLQKRLPGDGRVQRYPADEKGALEEIRARLDRIEDMLRRVVSTSLRPNITPPTPRTGRLVLVNNFPDTVLFIINQRTFRLVPGQSATIDNQPAGVFTYEVISQVSGSRGSFTRVLAAGETFTLTARQ